MRVLLALCVAVSCFSAEAQLKYERAIDWNLPDGVLKRFEAERLFATYDLCDKVNTFYLRGDFDGDGIPDYAVLVTNRSTKQVGIAFVRSGAKRVEVIGAGGIKLPSGASGNDFAWMDVWAAERKHKLEANDWDKPVGQMIGEGITVEKSESASALIYWDGKQYRWF